MISQKLPSPQNEIQENNQSDNINNASALMAVSDNHILHSNGTRDMKRVLLEHGTVEKHCTIIVATEGHQCGTSS